ncbi:LETM1-like protein-domain-containing protein [Neohortaea acidophila]|uniref:LETM1-like protein-domain-containing protein n=1 Tax=Neohortaea acidophila TaxID=245834 RepID=A0A6A6PS93_9PEZI|nr:LETM1-like protein-domain-containing protein [Neohortaea acidophila]KAF2482353.1 LETM1-like protein-domain-containing protein [Neohortaea acidophila]
MLTNKSATRLAPLLLRTGQRAAFHRAARFPRHTPAIAILVPRRRISTETSTTHGTDGPPPGFNIEQAKKPLSKDAAEKQASKKEASSKSSSEQKSQPDVNIPVAEPSVQAPTKASESRSLSELASEKAATESQEKKELEKKEAKKKLTLWQKVKHELQHYWDGTKLLATEVRISSRLALKMSAGYELTRREHRQLHRTVQDLGRLVPFSVFLIVPFAELLLPVALKLFPNLLPSTYEGAKSKEAKATRLRMNRKEVSNFLRSTLRESGIPISAANAQKEEFTEFFRKVRATGESPTKSDVVKVCKLFKDDLTLDNLSRPQLVGICTYMNLSTFGTDTMLRYQVRHRMRQIKRDDKAIAFEGVDSLSVPELQTACASRGLRTHGMSPGRLRDDLQLWLDLRLKYGVPSTLLVLSNAFMYAQGKETEFDSQIDALQAVLSSIPEELFHEIELEVHNAEGAATNRQRLEVLREQQELITEESEQSQSGSSVSDIEDIDEKEEDRRQEAALAKESAQEQGDAAVAMESENQAATGEDEDAKMKVEEPREAEREQDLSEPPKKEGER